MQEHSESRWPASLAVAVALGLYVLLPHNVITGLGPRWLIPALEGTLGGALLLVGPRRVSRESAYLRTTAVVLIALVNVANVVSLVELVHDLLFSAHGASSGRALVYASVPIWITNVIVFGLWYWELDGGGPGMRAIESGRIPEFLFPQMSVPQVTGPGWKPRFLDYLYVSFTNATAFSPTDTMPLSVRAKALMALQSLASLLTVALVISRAVNILG
ncbi:MAG: hypothetical protein ACYDD4_06170 [Acidimicrobiales bacterium]